MAEAAKADTTLRAESETVATHELNRKHTSQLIGAEPQLIQIEGVAQTLVLMSGSDAFEDKCVTESMAFLACTLLEECKEIRKKLYD